MNRMIHYASRDIRSGRPPAIKTLYILAHDVALLAIADWGLWIADWIVGFGFRREAAGRVVCGKCARAASIGVSASGEFGYASVRNEGDLIDGLCEQRSKCS